MVVVDSSVLIHLSRIGKLSLLKTFFKKIIITPNIYEEMKEGTIGISEFEKALEDWIILNKPKNLNEIEIVSKLERIEKPDASIIILAREKRDIILSNDYALIKVARSKSIECWWLTTFILHCLARKKIIKEEAKQILFDLVESGMRLDNAVYTAILKEIENM